jgi:signal transduction histidine kinase/CheY-like chemotaxis protein
MTTLDHLETGRSIVDPSVTIPHEPGRRIAAWLPFAAAVCVPLIVLAVMGAFSFTQTRHEAELRAQRTVHALAEHALRTFRAHDLIIKAVDSHIAGWDWSAIDGSRDLHEFFKRLMQDADDINTIFVVGPSGREGNSSLLFPLAPTNMAGRPFYEDLKQQGGLHISAPDVGRVNRQRYFSFTRRRTSADGSFDGVISVSVNPAYFEAFYGTVVEGPADSVALVRSDGLLLVRVPAAPPRRERMLPRTPGSLMATIAEHPERGTFSQRGSVDGVERIYSYRRVGDYPVYASYGLSYDTVWDAWRRTMLAYGLVCLTAIALLIAAAALVRRHHRRESDAANRYLQETARRMAAEETSRAKDEFLAALGHELRNPLSSIAASAEILRRSDIHDGNAVGAVGIIGRQVEHLRRLLNDLLDVARSIYGKMQFDPTVVSLRDVAAGVAATYPGAIRREVAVTVDGVRGWARADPTRVRQMIENLVDNAHKYGARNIAVRVTESGDWVEVAVADDGDGIPADLLPTMFEPFVQGKQPLDRSVGGLGLGLALCHRLATAHGGTLHATSDGPGKGSTFTIRLPRAAPPDEPAQSSAGASAPAVRNRVLVIEDQQDARESLRMLLELDDHVVEAAATGREGVAKFDAFHPDVVLVDIGLPEMNGYEVARAIRSRASGTRVRMIALTGYGQPSDELGSIDAGFDYHVTKPVDYERLKELMDTGSG